MDILIWTTLAFISGSIPFSVIVGRLAGGGDIRQVGDHNPGATNVLRATNWRWFALAVLLDALKGAIPVGLAWFGGSVQGWQLLPIAVAPILGHAFSPFLRGRGGKAVATTFGVWVGLTLGAVPTIFGLLLGLMYATITVSGWAVILSFGLLGIFIYSYYAPLWPQFFGIWLANFLILIWKHRNEIKQKPGIRRWWSA